MTLLSRLFFLTAILISFDQASACDVLENKMSLTDILFSSASGRVAIVPSNNFEGLTLTNCKGGYVQLAQGAILPHPQVYTGMMFLEKDIATAPRCAGIDKNGTVNDLAFPTVAAQHVDLAKACMGLSVKSDRPLELVNNHQCEVVSRNNTSTALIVKGDNCVFAATPAGLIVVPTVLSTCQGFAAASEVKELDLLLTVQKANTLSAQETPDSIASKPVRLTISSNEKSADQVLSKKSVPGLSVYTPSEYRLKMKLSGLTLNGSTETGLEAEASYLVERDEKSASNQYRIPLVIRNEMFLVQAGRSEFLGGWYNGSVLSAQWSGRDGLASFNKLFDVGAPGKLNGLAKKMRVGDRIVLVSRLDNPNAGPRKFLSYIKALNKAAILQQTPKAQKNQTSKTLNTSLLLPQLPTLDAIESIKAIEELPSLTRLNEVQREKVKEFFSWPVRYNTVCINELCAPIDQLKGGFEIQSLYTVESADFDVKVKLEEQLTKWNSKVISNKNLNAFEEVQCQ